VTRRRTPGPALVAAGLLAASVAGGPPRPDPPVEPVALTLERIMDDPEWIARSPSLPYWSHDSRVLYYEIEREGSELRELYELPVDGSPRRVTDERLPTIDADPDEGDHDSDRSHHVYERHGDLFVEELATGEVRQLTRTAAREFWPFFLAGDDRVAFGRDGAIFVRHLDTGLESQPYVLEEGEDPEADDAEDEEDDDYLTAQQARLFGVLAEREARTEEQRERERARREADPTRAPHPFYLGKRSVDSEWLSPSGRAALVVVHEGEQDRGRRDTMPDWVTAHGYVDTQAVRRLVGTGRPVSRQVLLLDLDAHQMHELDLGTLPGIREDPLADVRAENEAWRAEQARADGDGDGATDQAEATPEEPAPRVGGGEAARDHGARASGGDVGAGDHTGAAGADDGAAADGADAAVRDEGAARDAAGDGTRPSRADEARAGDDAEDEREPRPVSIFGVSWHEEGTAALFFVRSRDNKDRWLCHVDARTRALTVVERLHDPAWINWRFNDAGWLPDGRLWFLSEASGWSHAYVARVDDGHAEVRALTRGPFEVSDVEPSRDGTTLYVRANAEHPGRYELYAIDVARGTMARRTSLGGRNRFVISPDETKVVARHGTTTTPPELYLQSLEPGSMPRRLTTTVTRAYESLELEPPRIVPVPSSHVDAPIWSRLYLPPDDAPPPAADGRRPAVLFVHGAGYLQNAHHGWSGYFREFLFHQLLARRGYVVLDMDYRGSAGYGRDWRTAIYRDMGGPELEDYLDGIDWLAEHHGVDPARVGIYGGSYGGFLTLMALFDHPDRFAAGAALRPVTDWAHYNHGYTSNILNTPEVDPLAYARSSPIEHAEGLDDPLLICHGMLDDNVFFKDTVRLTQRLIELGKQGWEVAMYPVEPHGFREPSSWLDEYRRILRLFEETLGDA